MSEEDLAALLRQQGYQMLDMRDQIARMWKPIETAPKDGTFVLCAMDSGHISILQFCRGGYWRRDVFSAQRAPTHWMPLPDPPEYIPSLFPPRAVCDKAP